MSRYVANRSAVTKHVESLRTRDPEALIRESGTWADEKRHRMHRTRYKGKLKNNDVVESTSELATSVGGKLPTDGALHRWPLF